MFPTKNSITLERRVELIDLLNIRLSEATDLYSQVKTAHWNVKGPNFIGLHELFDNIAESVSKHIDIIAERVAQLGGLAQGTIHSAVLVSKLPMFSTNISNQNEILIILVESVSVFARNVRVSQGWCTMWDDQDTLDIFVDVSRDMDKHLWMLEAHLL
jgi:starvation-inducible DNA-binding protein